MVITLNEDELKVAVSEYLEKRAIVMDTNLVEDIRLLAIADDDEEMGDYSIKAEADYAPCVAFGVCIPPAKAG